MENQFNRASRPDAERQAESDGLVSHLKAILEVFRNSSRRGMLLWFGAGLALVVGATVYGQIRLNAWSRPFYDALSRKDLSGFASQLFAFVIIAGALLVLNVAQTWLNQMTKVTLRDELTRDLFAQWLSPGRAFLLAGAGEVGVNPDQRIHEDARHLAELSTDLCVGLFQATLLLTSFIAVLWFLSTGVVFEFQGAHLVIPGYMVWCALFYSGVASWASWRVGRPLVQLNAERYARESDLRFALVHVNEHNEGIAVHRGEAEEKSRLQHALDSLVIALRGLVSSTTRLTWVTAGYGWFTIIAPIIVAAPAYFMGNLSFGGMLMAVGAFEQVQQSLRWFVDNVGVIADWRATLFRVGGLRCALIEMDRLGDQASRIELGWSGEDKLCLDDLGVISPTGYTTLSESCVEIMPKDHVLILGAPASGKTSLFRAMAGLWSWGKGKITLPPAKQIMFMPKRPYIPDGALRDVLAYPASSRRFTTQELEAVLASMDLSYLSCWLDREARWDKELSEPDQQGLAFARVLLHKPRWVIIDEAIGSLRAEARIKLFDIFEKELATTAVIYISGSQTEDKFFTRVLRLTKQPRGPGPTFDARPLVSGADT
ncbi:MAG TPA: ABC transporter ATP-binding protein/permease [Methylocystis sp.]|jgi:putative ATP-binding cassette transporter